MAESDEKTQNLITWGIAGAVVVSVGAVVAYYLWPREDPEVTKTRAAAKDAARGALTNFTAGLGQAVATVAVVKKEVNDAMNSEEGKAALATLKEAATSAAAQAEETLETLKNADETLKGEAAQKALTELAEAATTAAHQAEETLKHIDDTLKADPKADPANVPEEAPAPEEKEEQKPEEPQPEEPKAEEPHTQESEVKTEEANSD